MEAKQEGAQETTERHESAINDLCEQTRDLDKRLTKVESIWN